VEDKRPVTTISSTEHSSHGGDHNIKLETKYYKVTDKGFIDKEITFLEELKAYINEGGVLYGLDGEIYYKLHGILYYEDQVKEIADYIDVVAKYYPTPLREDVSFEVTRILNQSNVQWKNIDDYLELLLSAKEQGINKLPKNQVAELINEGDLATFLELLQVSGPEEIPKKKVEKIKPFTSIDLTNPDLPPSTGNPTLDEVARLRLEAKRMQDAEGDNWYEEKIADKKDYYAGKAVDKAKESEAIFNRQRKLGDVIPFGQPILVGHHSEKKDRRFRDSLNRMYEKSVEEGRKANYYANKAATIGTGGINSDDPAAVRKLKEKLADLMEKQALMKVMNRAFKAYKKKVAELIEKQPDISTEEVLEKTKNFFNKYAELGEKEIALVRKHDDSDSYSWNKGRMFPQYALTNNNAKINNTKKRIAKLEEIRQYEDSETEYPQFDLRIVIDTTENRLRFHFEGTPDEETRTFLKKQMGLNYSPTNDANQRKLSQNNDYYIREVLKFLEEKNAREAKEVVDDKTLVETAIVGMKASLEFLEGEDKKEVETAIAGMEASLEFL
ncbi:MAG: DUF3560 domain-containing protein, partial [Bacteroidota bacterium]